MTGIIEAQVKSELFQKGIARMADYKEQVLHRELHAQAKGGVVHLLDSIGGIRRLNGKELVENETHIWALSGMPVPTVLVHPDDISKPASQQPFMMIVNDVPRYQYVLQPRGITHSIDLETDGFCHVTKMIEQIGGDKITLPVAVVSGEKDAVTMELGFPYGPVALPKSELLVVFAGCQLKQPGFAAVGAVNIL